MWSYCDNNLISNCWAILYTSIKVFLLNIIIWCLSAEYENHSGKDIIIRYIYLYLIHGQEMFAPNDLSAQLLSGHYIHLTLRYMHAWFSMSLLLFFLNVYYKDRHLHSGFTTFQRHLHCEYIPVPHPFSIKLASRSELDCQVSGTKLLPCLWTGQLIGKLSEHPSLSVTPPLATLQECSDGS